MIERMVREDDVVAVARRIAAGEITHAEAAEILDRLAVEVERP